MILEFYENRLSRLIVYTTKKVTRVYKTLI
jgi:hypothetical protein